MAGNFDAKTDPLAPTHPIAPKFFLVADKKILDTGCGADEYAWLLRTGRALDARAEPRIKSADVHDETEAQHLILGVALLGNGSLIGTRRRGRNFVARRIAVKSIGRTRPPPSPAHRKASIDSCFVKRRCGLGCARGATGDFAGHRHGGLDCHLAHDDSWRG